MKKILLVITILFSSLTFAYQVAFELHVKGKEIEHKLLLLYLLHEGSGPPIYKNILIAPKERIILDDVGSTIQLQSLHIPEIGEMFFMGMAQTCTIGFPKLDEKYIAVLTLNLKFSAEKNEWTLECQHKAVIPGKSDLDNSNRLNSF